MSRRGHPPPRPELLIHTGSVIEAKASGMIDHLVEISKLPATDITLDELKSATQDHDQYVESLAKKASAIQLNLDRCKTLMQSSDNWTKDRLEAKNSKLNALKAAKARLEAAVSLPIRGSPACRVGQKLMS